VLTAEGSRPIESIRPGDLVQSYDTLSGRPVIRPVLEVERRRTRRLLRLRPGGGEELRVTPGHYFGVPSAGWVRARELEAGDRLIAPDGAERSFSTGSPQLLPRAVTVYNLVVREHNVYFVGRPPVLVHSCTTIGFTVERR
jgi:intein/homing endonuclease